MKKIYSNLFVFFLMLIINNCCFVSYPHQIIPNHNKKNDCHIINTLDAGKLYDSKYILHIVINEDEKFFLT